MDWTGDMIEIVRGAVQSIHVAEIETRQRLTDCIVNDNRHLEHLGRL